MMKLFSAIFCCLLLGACQQATETGTTATTTTTLNYEHPIPYEPREYVCYQTAQAPVIDGQLENAVWEKVPWTVDFVDIEGDLKPKTTYRTRAKMLWDEQYFYFAAEIEEPHLWATITERDAVMYNNDDFEIFIDPDGDGQNYYEFEMNANNAVWDLLMLYPYRVDTMPNYLNNWDIKGIKTGVTLVGTLNDPSDTDSLWRVEIAMPWSALKELAPEARMPKDGEQWRVNFSRVDWHMDIVEGVYKKQIDPKTGIQQKWPEENWVWSPSGRVDMHQTETWGFVQFSNQQPSDGPVAFQKNPDEAIKWALWQLYFQQEQHWEQHGSYTNQKSSFTLPKNVEGFSPQVATTPNQFEIMAAGVKGGIWHINERGRIWWTEQ
ncbi:MAG: hypothetical protein DHS20C18_02680 [Saprospiraceae bacterium]|nr:MAG: hypothetical protein DHS20C18_02680 [Saprospiraceae bacterium]